jgi:hypothetical protein
MSKVKVVYIIEVPKGIYCWGYGEICEHFDNEGGYSTCDLGFDNMEDVAEGTLKPWDCLKLKYPTDEWLENE